MYRDKYLTNDVNKGTTNQYKYFLESSFVRDNRFFVLIYLNEDNNPKNYKAHRYCLLKGMMKVYDAVIIGKNFATD